MISPTAIYNEILGGILNRIPGGHQVFQQIAQGNQSRHANNITDASSKAVTRYSESTENLTQNIENEISFNAILDYFSTGGTNISDDFMRQAIEAEIEAAAIRNNLDPSLVRAVVRVESNYRHDAVSHAGAMGLMQLMPGTAASLGVTDPFDIRQNIDGGTRYLRSLLDMFDNDLELALAAYNAGQGNVRRFGGIPPFQETINFVPRVQQHMERYTLERYTQAREDSRF